MAERRIHLPPRVVDLPKLKGGSSDILSSLSAHTRRAYVFPARHFASSNTSTNLRPMGMRVRLKASFDISDFSPRMQVILWDWNKI